MSFHRWIVILGAGLAIATAVGAKGSGPDGRADVPVCTGAVCAAPDKI